MQLLENKLFLNFQDDSLYEVDCPSETNITVKYNAEVLTDDEQLVTTSVTTTSTVPASTGKSVFLFEKWLKLWNYSQNGHKYNDNDSDYDD